MSRWAIYRTATGQLLRYGYVAAAADLGAPDADESSVEIDESIDLCPSKIYAWNGSAFIEAGPATAVAFHASSTRANADESDLTASWITVERVLTKVRFFAKNAQGIFVNAIGQVQADGGTVLLRVIEDPGHESGGVRYYDTSDDHNLTDRSGVGYIEISDTGGDWTAFDFHSDQPLNLDDHHSEYRLEAKLGSATSGKIRAPSIGLLEAHGRIA
jgi:hypothetical protein